MVGHSSGMRASGRVAGGGWSTAVPDLPLLDALLAQDIVAAVEIDTVLGRVVQLNRPAAAWLGYTAQDQRAGQLVLLAGPPDAALPRDPADDASGPVHLRRHDGSFAAARIARLACGPGRMLLLITPQHDMPVHGHEALQDYRDIYENVSEGIYRSTVDGRQVSANPALVLLNGYDCEAEMLAAVNDIAVEWYVDPGRRDEFTRLLHEPGRVENFVSEIYRHKTRERIWISENARLVRDPVTGLPRFYEGTIRDVTETVRRLDLEQRLRTIIETIADGVIAVDASGNVHSANRAAEAMLGWPPGELVGQPLAPVLQLGEAGAPALGHRRDGSRFPADVAAADAETSAGLLHIYCVRDASARLADEQKLREAKEAAERANRAKSDFLAMMSHELRTPLNAVIGMAGLLLDGPLDAQSRRYAETLRDGADLLMQLIGDVLDFSKLDAGRVEFEDIPFEVEAVVHGTLDLMAHRAHGKGLEIAALIGPAVPPYVSGDPGRLRQVLINLVGNAIKFTDTGAVTVEVDRQSGGDGWVELAFEVHDTGIGIAPDQLPQLFKEFSQLDSSISRRFGGTGLGLAISNRLVGGMGGVMTVTSEPGRGSTFRFTVRLRELPSQVPRREAVREQLHGERILVVDDNPINRSIFARQLEGRGASVMAVADSRAAMRALRNNAASGTAFAAAVIDHIMPGTDGERLGRTIRNDPAVPPLRLVLATSSAVGPEARTAAEVVFDSVLSKPVPVDVLVRAVRGGAVQPVERRVSPSDIPDAAAGRLSVLVAEDNLTNQVVIRALIERLGHAAVVVDDGEQAVAAAGRGTFDVVLMDVMMPVMDGLQATRLIRQLPAPFGRVPVLGLTAHIGADDHAAFIAAGMDSVLTKPVTAKALADALGALVKPPG